MICSKCGADYFVKNGNRQDKQCYLCKVCGYQFTGDSSLVEKEKRVAITLCCFGLSMRKIGALLGYSHVTIINWVREFEKKREKHSENYFEHYFLELDEMCAFLNERTKNPRLGRRFATMQAALQWNMENEMSKIMEKVFASLTG